MFKNFNAINYYINATTLLINKTKTERLQMQN